MKRLLLLIPKCPGPAAGKKWNAVWPADVEAAVTHSMWKLITPGPLVLAKLAQEMGRFEVHLTDEAFQPLNLTKKYDIVAIYTVTPNVKRAYELADFYKKQGTYVVLGGVHTTVCPEEAGRHAHTILIGEAESIWTAFLQDFLMHRTRQIYAQPLGKVSMYRSPIPAFHLIPENARKLIPIQTARGCPHGCHFCNLRSLYGRSYRPKKMQNIEKELRAVKQLNPHATIYFTDDNLFCSSTHADALMQLLQQYSVTWYANTDISFGADPVRIRRAYQCGCRQVLIGLESVNMQNLTGLDETSFKRRHFGRYREWIENIQSQGIGVIGSFILGLDGDGTDVFDKTAEFILEANLFGASITVNTPYPGTVQFHELDAQNRICTYDWNCYTIFNPVIQPKKMSIETLNAGYLKVLRAVHSTEAAKRKLEYFKRKIKEAGNDA